MFFDLLLFPCGIEEGDEVEGGQPVQSQGNAPAECWPDGPELMRAGDEIDHDQHGDDHDILRHVQIEFLDLSHAFECDGFLGFSCVDSNALHVRFLFHGQLRHVDLEDGC